ncbi:MAG: hypothetical protein ACLVKI_03220 [Gordonibacter urolithinfaciens]
MPAETVVPPRFRAPEPQPRRHALTLAIVVCALAAVLFALAPGQADAAPAGPFDVEGPADAYAWDGAVLSVTGDGVTIAGMADLTSAAMGDAGRRGRGRDQRGLGRAHRQARSPGSRRFA